jgi:hypothetical protein
LHFVFGAVAAEEVDDKLAMSVESRVAGKKLTL